MTPRSPSPPLIKGIDGIVSRPPNEVNFSTMNGKMMKTGKPIENERRLLWRKGTLALQLLQLNKYLEKKEKRINSRTNFLNR